METRELETLCDRLDELETSVLILKDAIDGASVIDWDMLNPNLAEGAREALVIGQVTMAERIFEGIHDAHMRLRKACANVES